jgi:nucleotide-binding universal stress UspA family protein
MTKRLGLRRILCPMDFSALSTASLATAGAMARARNADLKALHVVPADGVEAASGLGGLDHQELMAQLRERLTAAAPGYDRIGAATRQGDPGTQILRFARTMPADLIVMGAPGADRPERPMGPVTSVVVTRSDCPVLTVPARQATAPAAAGLFHRIVCAVDLTPSSRIVIRQALAFAWETRGHVTFVCALAHDSPRSPADTRGRLLDAMPPESGDWCETDVRVTHGEAGAQIVGVADELKPDLVVIGAPRRWTSATHAVLGQSLCPVLVTHDARPLPKPTPTSKASKP